MQGVPIGLEASLCPSGSESRGPLLHLRSSTGADTPAGASSERQANLAMDRNWVRCATCSAPLVRPVAAIAVNGEHRHRFINPRGYVFDVRCFCEWRGLAPCGPPSREWTWFSGHSWQIQLCARCSAAVGWLFEGAGTAFVGLDAAKLSVAPDA